jgi:putative ABC transport system permease protein
MRKDPPRFAQLFLLWFLREDLAEEVLGDLDEKFGSMVKKSPLRAKLNYWYQLFNYLRPFAFRKSRSRYFNNFGMLENYFKIGWRNMSKQKMYSSIKVGGFALGIAACLLITLFIRNELSYDRHYPKASRIYRVVEQYVNKGQMERGVHLPAPAGPALKADYPEIAEVARLNASQLFGGGNNDIRPDGKVENTHEDGFVWADPEFLPMLDATFIYGNEKTALSEPNSIVLTKSKADKYFPNEDPIGKLMIVANDQTTPFRVGGVIEDFPPTSHIDYSFFMSLAGKEFGKGEQTNWLQSNYPTYVLLHEGVDAGALEKKLAALGEKYYLPVLTEIGFPDVQEAIKNLSYQLQPVGDIYLNELQVGDGLNHGDLRFLWLSGAVAVFILLIACVNFINLSTAKSANRAKEVGLRKVVGSFRKNLIGQFLSESLLFTFFSFLLGLFIAWLLFPMFNQLVGKSIVFPWKEWWLFPSMLAGSLLIGFLAGIYPSFYLSAFRPIDVLKGKVARGSRNPLTRSVLVVFQFTTSIVLVISTFVIYRQMEHILTAKIGFDKEQVIMVQGADLLGDKVTTFKEELLAQRDIQHVTISDYLPIMGTKRNGNGFWNEGKKEVDPAVGAQFWRVDHDYLKTLGIALAQGRDFSKDMPTDSDGAIINQAMANELGLKDPVGKRIENYKTWTVIGVIENFNFESLKENVRPLCLVLGSTASIVTVKVKTADMPSVIESITGVWKEFAPQQPIRYTFLNETYARMYEDVERMGTIFTTFAVLAIIVACLGLFGLSSFIVEQRSKEISIRLVLGASVNNIFRLLTQNFVVLVLISFILAAPVAWYLMQQWLKDFVQKIDMTWDLFAVAGSIAVVIALITVSYQAIRAAVMSPVDSLKTE